MEQWRKELYSDYLAHHGVMGMHWGIRRYQPYSTAPRGSGKGGKEVGEAANKKTAKKISKSIAKGNSHISQKDFNRIKEPVFNSSEVKKAYKNYKDIRTKYENDKHNFYNNTDLWKKWAIKAADKSFAKYGKDNPGVTKQQWRDSYLHDDADQGEDNSYDLYLKSKGSSYRKETNKVLSSARDLEDVSRKAVYDYLGKEGERKVKSFGQTDVADRVAQSLSSNALDEVWNITSEESGKTYKY